jgi:hypothetical protein
VIPEKFLTFALPTERKGKKIGTADAGKITEKRLKRIETQVGRTRPAGTETEDI